ncbi:MAG: class I SAM-dependent methyltransferase [Nitrospirae bacterium]|nr:class I SAM-dependent methyltransferase [Nitrospirota bacterium]
MEYNPDTGGKFKIVMNTYRVFGFWETLKEILLYLLSQKPHDDFDKKYGVMTSGVTESSEAGIADETARSLAVGYVPTREVVIRHILESTTKELDLNEFTFVDLGCGKGRTLIVAAQLPFKEVIGVELSPLHCEVAEANIKRYLSDGKQPALCRNVRVSCANAANFVFPDTNLLIYMYRPFLGPIFKHVADNLRRFQAVTGHRVLIAYSCPVEELMLEEYAGFVKRTEYQVISMDYSWSLWECQAEISPILALTAQD